MANSFVMYKDWSIFFDALDDAGKGQLIDAIMRYQTGRELPSMNDGVKMAFSFICAQFQKDSEKYEEKVRTRSESGKMGGRPKNVVSHTGNSETNAFCEKQTKANGFEENQTKAKKANGFEENQTKAKKADNDNDNVNDYENDCVNDNENENEKALSLVSNETNCQTQAVRRVVDEWNTLVDVGVKPISKLSSGSKRLQCLTARLREYGEEDVLKAVDRIRKSDFLQGRHTGKPWQITFDWFVLPNNFPKVLDGNYDNDVGHSFGGYGKSSGKVDWDAV